MLVTSAVCLARHATAQLDSSEKCLYCTNSTREGAYTLIYIWTSRCRPTQVETTTR